MPTLTITKSYADGNVLTEADLDNFKDDVEAFLNTTKIDADNIQNSGVTTAKINNDAVDKDKIAADVAGLGLAQNADGSLETDSDAHSIVQWEVFS